MENELDQLHIRMEELHTRTDMNIKGRLIEELEHIPNVVENISSLFKLNDKIDKVHLQFDALEYQLVNIDKRVYSLMVSNDKLDVYFINIEYNFEDFKAINLDYCDKFKQIEDRLNLFASRNLFES